MLVHFNIIYYLFVYAYACKLSQSVIELVIVIFC